MSCVDARLVIDTGMSSTPTDLPHDPHDLRRVAGDLQRDVAALSAEVHAKTLLIEKLKMQLAVLRRARFGRSSEKLDSAVDQLELLIDDLEESEAEHLARSGAAESAAPAAAKKKPSVRAPLPDHLPQERIVHEAPCVCPTCGGQKFGRIDADEREVLEYVPSHFKRVLHVRPKMSCRACETIVQAPMPTLPIEKGRPGPALLAHVIVSKYCDHLPLHRQSDIYAREGVEIDRSVMAGWVGHMAALLEPLSASIGKHVRAGPSIHADDTPVPVLDPGRGKTKTGRLWTAVRDERPFGSTAPAAAFYLYSPDRKAEHARALLETCRGFLHADGYAGFAWLYQPDPRTGAAAPLTEVACWAHLWMPPLLQGFDRRFGENPRLLSSIRPVMTTRPASLALMVNPQAETQSRVTSSRLDAPSGFIRLRFARSRHHTLKDSSHPRRPLDQPVSEYLPSITRLAAAVRRRRRHSVTGPTRCAPSCWRARRQRHWPAGERASAPARSMTDRASA